MRLSAGGKALKIISYAFLIIGAVIILFPFYVTIITAMKTQQQSAESFFSFPHQLLPGELQVCVPKGGLLQLL